MQLNRRQCLAAAMVATITPAASRGDTPDWDIEFSEFMSQGMAKTRTPGMAVAVVRGAEIVLARGYGFANIETKRLVTADTAFHVASVGKTVTAMAMMMQYEAGEFALDDDINRYLDFKVVHPGFPETPITFRQLMDHTSGISDQVYDGTPEFVVSGDPVLELRDFLMGYLTSGGRWYDASRCFGEAPGKAWRYSNVAIALLGYLSERVGTRLDTFTQRELFAPLGMRNTSWTYAGLAPEKVATPYDVSAAQPKALRAVGYPDWPAGLLRTSANDFARFLAIHTTNGTLDGHTYVRPETLAAMMTAQPVPTSEGQRQGLVWQLLPFGSVQVALHAGNDPGASALVSMVLGQQTAFLVFANASGNDHFAEFRSQIVNRLAQRASA